LGRAPGGAAAVLRQHQEGALLLLQDFRERQVLVLQRGSVDGGASWRGLAIGAWFGAHNC
jgi:hypothetical protein